MLTIQEEQSGWDRIVTTEDDNGLEEVETIYSGIREIKPSELNQVAPQIGSDVRVVLVNSADSLDIWMLFNKEALAILERYYKQHCQEDSPHSFLVLEPTIYGTIVLKE